MPKPWYSIKASAEGSDVAEVSILDAISPWYGVDAKSFLTEFRALKATKVKLFINSPGGSVTEALAIFNGMRATGKHIEVHVLGIAASAASYIAMAGDRVVMPKNTLMFLHNPIGGVYGNADEMRDYADTLDKLGTMLTATYAKRFKGEDSVLQQFMKDEALLTADECFEHGFCDEVVDEIAAVASFDVDALPPAARAVFRAAAQHLPEPAPAADATLAEQVQTHAERLGLTDYVATFLTAADSFDKAQARMGEAREIVALAKHTGLADRAAALIRGGKTLAEARIDIAAALQDASPSIDTSPPSKPGDAAAAAEFSPSALWAEIHAKKGQK